MLQEEVPIITALHVISFICDFGAIEIADQGDIGICDGKIDVIPFQCSIFTAIC